MRHYRWSLHHEACDPRCGNRRGNKRIWYNGLDSSGSGLSGGLRNTPLPCWGMACLCAVYAREDRVHSAGHALADRATVTDLALSDEDVT